MFSRSTVSFASYDIAVNVGPSRSKLNPPRG